MGAKVVIAMRNFKFEWRFVPNPDFYSHWIAFVADAFAVSGYRRKIS